MAVMVQGCNGLVVDDSGAWLSALATNTDLQPTAVGRVYDENGFTCVSDPYKGGLRAMKAEQFTAESLEREAIQHSFNRGVTRELSEMLWYLDSKGITNDEMASISEAKGIVDTMRTCHEPAQLMEKARRVVELLHPAMARVFGWFFELSSIKSKWGYTRHVYLGHVYNGAWR